MSCKVDRAATWTYLFVTLALLEARAGLAVFETAVESVEGMGG